MKILVFNEKDTPLTLNPYRHNLVVATKNVERLSDADFRHYDEETFICSSRKHKLYYAFIHLRSSWLIHSNRGLTSNYISEKEMRLFQSEHFVRWVRMNIPIFKDSINELSAWVRNDSLPYYDNHAPVLRFPQYRESELGIHIEFASAWINQFINNNYVMIGRRMPDKLAGKISEEKSDFISLTNEMSMSNPYPISCERDELNNEFIVHFWYRDAIVKIKL
jgi:hypothetical protein